MTSYFEDMVSKQQNLTFNGLKENIKTGIPQGIRTASGEFSNFAYALSDQCPWHLVLCTEDVTTRFTGPLPFQLDDCLREIDDVNSAICRRIRRVQHRRFPKVAIREALINAIIHSDLSFMCDIQVKVDEDRMQIFSAGGSYRPNPRMERPSTARNPRLASLMVDLGYATLKGSGTTEMLKCYEGTGVIPVFRRMPDEFIVFLPSIDSYDPASESIKAKICAQIKKRPGISFYDLTTRAMLSSYELNKILISMEMDGALFTLGTGMKRMIFLCDPAYEPRSSFAS